MFSIVIHEIAFKLCGQKNYRDAFQVCILMLIGHPAWYLISFF